MEPSKKEPLLKLCKVLAGRENWRARSNQVQKEKRKLQDRVRYLEGRIDYKNALLVQQADEIETLKKKIISPLK